MSSESKPSLKDYKSIRSYKDACKALGESVDEETLKKAGVPKHIIAQMKLELICKQFLEVWAEAIAYNFTVGERSK